MKRIIYKYSLWESDEVRFGRISISVPKGARILSVQPQRERPQIWALIDAEEKETETVTFQVWMTGQEILQGFWGGEIAQAWTLQFQGGAFILHVLLMKNSEP